MTTPDLKPCPFCGGEAVLMLDRESSGWYVLCKGCYSKTDTQIPSPRAPLGRDYDAVVIAIETAEIIWNRRANDVE